MDARQSTDPMVMARVAEIDAQQAQMQAASCQTGTCGKPAAQQIPLQYDPTREELIEAQQRNPGTVDFNSPLVRLNKDMTAPRDAFYGLYTPWDAPRYAKAKQYFEGRGLKIGGGPTTHEIAANPDLYGGVTGSVTVVNGVAVPNAGRNARDAGQAPAGTSYSLIAGSPQAGFKGQDLSVPRANMPFQPEGMITIGGMGYKGMPSYAIPTASLKYNNPWDPRIVNREAATRAEQIAAANMRGRAGVDPSMGLTMEEASANLSKYEKLKNEAMARGDTGKANYYQNQAQKAANNLSELSSAYHHAGKQMGIPVPANRYEAIGDLSVELLKGTPVRDTERFSPISGELMGILPSYTTKTGQVAGLGIQQDAWNQAKNRAAGKDVTFADFSKGVDYIGAAVKAGYQGPYGDLYGGKHFAGVETNRPLLGSSDILGSTDRLVGTKMVAGSANKTGGTTAPKSIWEFTPENSGLSAETINRIQIGAKAGSAAAAQFFAEPVKTKNIGVGKDPASAMADLPAGATASMNAGSIGPAFGLTRGSGPMTMREDLTRLYGAAKKGELGNVWEGTNRLIAKNIPLLAAMPDLSTLTPDITERAAAVALAVPTMGMSLRQDKKSKEMALAAGNFGIWLYEQFRTKPVENVALMGAGRIFGTVVANAPRAAAAAAASQNTAVSALGRAFSTNAARIAGKGALVGLGALAIGEAGYNIAIQKTPELRGRVAGETALQFAAFGLGTSGIKRPAVPAVTRTTVTAKTKQIDLVSQNKITTIPTAVKTTRTLELVEPTRRKTISRNPFTAMQILIGTGKPKKGKVPQDELLLASKIKESVPVKDSKKPLWKQSQDQILEWRRSQKQMLDVRQAQAQSKLGSMTRVIAPVITKQGVTTTRLTKPPLKTGPASVPPRITTRVRRITTTKTQKPQTVASGRLLPGVVRGKRMAQTTMITPVLRSASTRVKTSVLPVVAPPRAIPRPQQFVTPAPTPRVTSIPPVAPPGGGLGLLPRPPLVPAIPAFPDFPRGGGGGGQMAGAGRRWQEIFLTKRYVRASQIFRGRGRRRMR